MYSAKTTTSPNDVTRSPSPCPTSTKSKIMIGQRARASSASLSCAPQRRRRAYDLRIDPTSHHYPRKLPPTPPNTISLAASNSTLSSPRPATSSHACAPSRRGRGFLRGLGRKLGPVVDYCPARCGTGSWAGDNFNTPRPSKLIVPDRVEALLRRDKDSCRRACGRRPEDSRLEARDKLATTCPRLRRDYRRGRRRARLAHKGMDS